MITNKTFPELLFMLFVGSCVAVSLIPFFPMLIGFFILDKWPNMSRTVDKIIENTCAITGLVSYIFLIHTSLWFVIPLIILSLEIIAYTHHSNEYLMIQVVTKSLIFMRKKKYSVVYNEDFEQNFIYYVKDGVIKKDTLLSINGHIRYRNRFPKTRFDND